MYILDFCRHESDINAKDSNEHFLSEIKFVITKYKSSKQIMIFTWKNFLGYTETYIILYGFMSLLYKYSIDNMQYLMNILGLFLSKNL